MPITPNDPANFIPSMQGYSGQEPFRHWCQKVLPIVYDDSLSYYELLCKVTDYLNKAIQDVANVETNVDSLLNAYSQLQTYVNNYFNGLDVQKEINKKLDEMAADGSLRAALEPFWQNTIEKLNQLQQQVNDLVLNAGSEEATSAEIAQARNGFATLNDRLNTMPGYIRDDITNLNDMPTGWKFFAAPGINDVENNPGYGQGVFIMCYHNVAFDAKIQICFGYGRQFTRPLCVRTFYGNTWYPWQTISGTRVIEGVDVDLNDYKENGTYSFINCTSYTNLPMPNYTRYFSHLMLTIEGVASQSKREILTDLSVGGIWSRNLNFSSETECTFGQWYPIAISANTAGAITNVDELKDFPGIFYMKSGEVEGLPAANTGGFIINIGAPNINTWQQLYVCTNPANTSSVARMYIRSNINDEWKMIASGASMLYLSDDGKYTIEKNADTLPTGFTYISSTGYGDWTGLPTGVDNGLLISFKISNNTGVQFFTNYRLSDKNNYLFMRHSSNASVEWSEWSLVNGYTAITADDNAFDTKWEDSVDSITGSFPENSPFPHLAGRFSSFVTRVGGIQEFNSIVRGHEYAYARRSYYSEAQKNGDNVSEWSIIRDRPFNVHMGVTVIGDSLASGSVQNADKSSITNHYDQSWAKTLADRLGFTYYICGAGGVSTTEFLDENNRYGIVKLRSLPTTPIYFIGLGANDVNEDNPVDTYVENYKTIIEACRSKTPGCFVFCCATARSSTYKTYDTAMQEMVNRDYTFESDHVMVFDISEKINKEPISGQLVGSHYTWLGYHYIGIETYNKLLEIMSQNPNLFELSFSNLMGPSQSQVGYPYAW